MKHDTPSEDIFNEIKDVAKQIWRDNHSEQHANTKIKRIDSIENIENNAMECYNMFDIRNKMEMLLRLSHEACEYICNNN